MDRPGFSWKNRRRVVWGILAYVAVLPIAIIGIFIMGFNFPIELAETIIVMLYTAGMGIAGSYVFGAAWEHTALVKYVEANKKDEV